VKQEAQGDVTVLFTVTGLVVALPLIPVAFPYAVAWRAHDAKAQKQLQSVLDPVYEKRIPLIQERDPIADAGRAWSSGARAFLPSIPRGNIFPGLEDTEFNLKKNYGAENYARLEQNELQRDLEALMGDDPVQVEHSNTLYFSATYVRFLHAGWTYREAFNKEMYIYMMSSNTALEPTATAPLVSTNR
jgi:hypothetical protein